MHNIGKITRYIYLCKLVFQSRVSNLLHRNLLQGRKSLFIINFIFRVTVYYGLFQHAVQAFFFGHANVFAHESTICHNQKRQKKLVLQTH